MFSAQSVSRCAVPTHWLHEVWGDPGARLRPRRPPLAAPHLDPAHGFLGLHHADVLGGRLVRQQLGGAKVIGSKNDPIDQVLGVTGSGNWNTQSRGGE